MNKNRKAPPKSWIHRLLREHASKGEPDALRYVGKPVEPPSTELTPANTDRLP